MISAAAIVNGGLLPGAPCLLSVHRHRQGQSKFGFLADRTSRLGVCFKLVIVSSGNVWKRCGIDANEQKDPILKREKIMKSMAKRGPLTLPDFWNDAVQKKVNSWLSKTQNFLNEVTSPLIKDGLGRKSEFGTTLSAQDLENIFMAEQTIDCRMPFGNLSLAAIVSIEQFSRMNGLTGKKMQKIFAALAPEPVSSDARNLVEYCCFRFLSKDSSDVHPFLKEPAFQKLIFITMLAWENPYSEESVSHTDAAEKASFQLKEMLVREQAFVRIAPAVAGLAERSTAHYLYGALVGEEGGISLSSWCTFIDELLKVHDGRKMYQIQECPHLINERVLCIGSSTKRPVLKWKNNVAWPGKLILTDKALYFEEIGLTGPKDAIRFDLTKHDSLIEKTRVGPFGSVLFDSALSVSSATQSESWVLEFVDFGGEMRRDVWHAFISEVIALYKFICDYGPEDNDQLLFHVFGAEKGKERAIISASNSIARIQALQFIRKLSDDPIKLVQFSYLRNAPFGDVVYQTLAVNYWGGPLIADSAEDDCQPDEGIKSSEMKPEIDDHVFDIDRSVYLRNWKKSPSWLSTESVMFWRNSIQRQGIVLNKNLVVAGMTLTEKAALTCKQKFRVFEKTQATIDAAMLKGIPSNIDLFKELMLPLTMTAKNLEKLRRWEEPKLTVSFLAFAYAIIFRNLLSYVFPTSLMILAVGMLLLKGLKDQGRLGRSFGKVTISDQPPSNTIQKIIAVKGAMDDIEGFLQNLNVTLLKMRTIILAGQPQIAAEVALVLLFCGTILLVVPFKYVVAFLLFDLFTRELKFRRELVRKFMKFFKERWDTVPAAPVVILPYKSDDATATHQRQETGGKTKHERTQEQR